MHGRKPICNVCRWQIRPVDAPTDTGCFNDAAQFKSDFCTGYEPVSHEHLANRFVILATQLSIVWDIAMLLLERAERLPEVPE